jgi:hypothetical protein
MMVRLKQTWADLLYIAVRRVIGLVIGLRECHPFLFTIHVCRSFALTCFLQYLTNPIAILESSWEGTL